MSSLRPLAWVLVVALLAPLLDRALARLYLTFTANTWAQIGDEMGEILRARPTADLLVIGDSSARHAVDVAVVDGVLGTDGYNFGAYRPAFTGQIAHVIDELEAGRRVRAVVIVTTDHGAAAGFGPQERAVSENYYRSLRHVGWWWRADRLSPLEAVDWLFALVSPTFGAGKPVETFAEDIVRLLRAGSLAEELSRRRAITDKRRADDAAYDGHYHLGVTPNRVAVARGVAHWRELMGLDSGRARWRVHADVEAALEWLLAHTDRHGVPVFFVFTPRHRSLREHPRTAALVEAPQHAWAERMRARHASFHFIERARALPLDDADFFDTADHLSRDASVRFSGLLAQEMAAALDAAPGQDAAAR